MGAFAIEHAGTTWHVGKPTRASRDALEDLVVQTAWARIEDLRRVSPAAFAEAKAEFTRAAGADEYKAGGKSWLAAVNGPGGNTLFLLSLLREAHPGATAADARALFAAKTDAVEAALAVVVPSFFGLLAGLEDTPPEVRAQFREIGATAPPYPSAPTPPGSTPPPPTS